MLKRPSVPRSGQAEVVWPHRNDAERENTRGQIVGGGSWHPSRNLGEIVSFDLYVVTHGPSGTNVITLSEDRARAAQIRPGT